MDSIYWAFKEGEQIKEEVETTITFDAKIIEKSEKAWELVYDFIIKYKQSTPHAGREKVYLPKSQVKKIKYEGENYYVLPHWLAESNGLTFYLNKDIGSRLATERIQKEKEKLDITLPIYETIDDYLQVITNKNMLMDESQLKAFGYELKESDTVLAYRLKAGNFVPLYNKAGLFTFIKDDEKQEHYVSEEIVLSFGLDPKEEEKLGYHFHYGNFVPLYDMDKIIKKYKWKEYKTNQYKKPIIKTNMLNSDYVRKNNDCIVGYNKGRKYYCALFDIEKALKKEELTFFSYKDYTDVELPYCTPYFFQQFNLQHLENKSKMEGYWVNKNGELQEVYNLETILRNEPKVLTVHRAKQYDALVSFEEYQSFANALPTGYYRFLELIGITPDNHLIIRGPKTKKWEHIKRPLKTEINWSNKEIDYDVVHGEHYGTYGMKACNQCFNNACISSSSDSICGGYNGHTVAPDGTYLINCEYRAYE